MYIEGSVLHEIILWIQVDKKCSNNEFAKYKLVFWDGPSLIVKMLSGGRSVYRSHWQASETWRNYQGISTGMVFVALTQKNC